MKVKRISGGRVAGLYQLGVSLLEILGGLAIGSVVMTGLAQETNKLIDNTRDANTAEHAQTFARAAVGFVKDKKAEDPNFGQSLGKFYASDASMTAYLPPGFPRTNPYGQRPVLYVKKQPGSQSVQGFVMYEATSGTPARELQPGRREFVAAMAGLGGGYADASGTARGPGWTYTRQEFSQLGMTPPAPGMMVLALNLFDPTDVLSDRYVCRTAADAERHKDCNKLGVGIDAANNEIKNLSRVNNTSTFAIFAPRITIGGSSSTKTEVSINGALTATVLRATAIKKEGSECFDYERGSLARSAAAGEKFVEGQDQSAMGTGKILTCQQDPGQKDVYKWLPIFNAKEEKNAIIGCWASNGFCAMEPKELCRRRMKPDSGGTADDPVCDFDWKATKKYVKGKDGAGFQQYEWETEIGERTYCSVGFHAQTGPSRKYDVDPVTGQTEITWATDARGRLIRDKDNNRIDVTPPMADEVTGAPSHTFCRVYPKDKKWYIKVGSAYRTPVACHAVCLYGG